MRLRTQLALAFACLAIVPLALVLPWALSNLRRTLTQGFDTRVASAMIAARSVLEQVSKASTVGADELADSPVLEDFAREVHAGHATPSTTTLGERLMKSRGLSVLSLLDSRGVTLSSGHLPARLGDRDPTLFAATEQPSGREPLPVMVEVRGDAGPLQLPALVAARAVDYGETRIWVVAGTLLDDRLADQLSRLTGAEVTIAGAGSTLAHAGAADPPNTEKTIDFPPIARLTFAFSRAPQVSAEAGILRAFVLISGLGLLLAIVAGWVVARHLTRPLEALTTATRQLAAGSLGVSVREESSGEVGDLVASFNRMSAELKSVTERLISSERTAAWQEVARRLAHEIKNPLTPIQMSLETLAAARIAGSPEFDRLFKEGVKAMLEEVERLRRIVDEFSRFARLPKPRLAPVDPAELVRQVLALHAARPAGVRLKTEISNGMTVQADRDLLTQVLMNLLKNADEAIGGEGEIAVRVRRHPDGVAVEIQDSGPGVPAEHRARVFEPYFTTKADGSGLGLAIASRICQEHGGRLELDATAGGGALFRLVLPAPPEPLKAV
jgi:nitrogen fixation/metabolism regulation signal transduction histidine kinase